MTMKRMVSISIVAALAAPACRKHASKAPATGSGSAAVAQPAPAPAAHAPAPPDAGKPPQLSGDLPKECEQWRQMVEKLMACDKMPAAQRLPMKEIYDRAAAGWAGLSPESKAQLATSCKAGADAIMSSAKATCGW
jgi:hypothetical protein